MPPPPSTAPQEDLVRSLDEIRSERQQVMEEVCDLLSDVPASKMSSLFGLSAVHVQKKLAIR